MLRWIKKLAIQESLLQSAYKYDFQNYLAQGSESLFWGQSFST